VGCGSGRIRWDGEKKHNSTGGRVALRAWDICEKNGGEWARERCWARERGVGAWERISGAGLVRGDG